MTIDRLHLAELIEKGSDADLLREMMTFVVNRMMDVDVESLTGAAYGERSADRTNQRNGYRERPWHTTLGTLPVAIPKFSSHFPLGLYSKNETSGVATGPRQAHYKAGTDRIYNCHKHVWDVAGGRASRGKNDVRCERDQFCGIFAKVFWDGSTPQNPDL